MATNYDPWGTAGMYSYGGRTGDAEGGYETQWKGNQTVDRNGQQYLRVGDSTFYDKDAQPGEIIYDPVEGRLASQSLVSRVSPGSMFGSSTPFFLAALGGLGGFLAPAVAAGVGAAGLGEGAAVGAGAGLGEGAAAGGAFEGFGAGAGVEGAGAIGAGEGVIGGGASGGAAGAPASGGFNILDPSTWSNPFSSPGGSFNPVTDLPPGSGQLLGNADAGAGFEDYIGAGEGGMSGTAGAGASGGGGGSFDWSKFLSSGAGSIWPNLLGAGAGVLSSWLASNAQVKSAEEANAMLWAMYSQNRADLGPYREAGYGALGNLTNLTTPGKQVDAMMLDPGYQFRYDQGMNELNNRLKAGGKFYSGNALKAGQEYGQGFATNEFSNVFNRNAALAGIGQTAVNTGVGASNFTAGNVANNLTGMGNARASGYVGAGNAITGGIQNYLNNQQQTELLQLLAGRQY